MQVWFASVLAPSSAVSCSPWRILPFGGVASGRACATGLFSFISPFFQHSLTIFSALFHHYFSTHLQFCHHSFTILSAPFHHSFKHFFFLVNNIFDTTLYSISSIYPYIKYTKSINSSKKGLEMIGVSYNQTFEKHHLIFSAHFLCVFYLANYIQFSFISVKHEHILQTFRSIKLLNNC